MLVEEWVSLLDAGVLIGLGTGELVGRVGVHVGDLGAEGAFAFAVGFSQGPEPCGIDVCVADGGELVGVGSIGGGKE